VIRSLLEDVRFALRVLGKAPGYTFAAVVTLALAIGAITTTFSVVDGVLLRPLPFERPDELVDLWETSPRFADMSISYEDLLDWRAGQKGFTSIAGYRTESRALTGFSTPERIPTDLVSWDLFDVLGLRPVQGRTFTAEEDKKGAPAQVAILGNALWRSRFASDPTVVGQTVTLDGMPFTVIGIAPKSMQAFRGDEGMFIPLAWTQGNSARRGNHPGLYAVARLKPGVTFQQAKEDVETIGRRLWKEYPGSNDTVLPKLLSDRENTVQEVRPSLILLLCAAAFVLLIAIANVANLMLARGTVRRREMAIRAALGAGRGRLVRQLLVESAIVGLAAGVAGILISLWGIDYLAAHRPGAIPRFLPIELDRGVLAFSLVASLAAGILFGLLPALQISRTNLTVALKEGDARGGSAKGNRLRGVLVVAEVALALVLLVGAGLAVRAFSRVLHVDTGMKPDHLLTFSYSLPKEKYGTEAALRSFHQRLKARLEAVPGVKSVSLSNGMPLQGASESSFAFDGEPEPKAADAKFATVYFVQPGYFDTLGIQIVRGRAFTEADIASGVPKVIVDEEFAKKFLDPGNPFSKRFRGDAENHVPPIEIIGIARHVTHYGLEGPVPTPYQDYLLWQLVPPKYFTSVASALDVEIRTEGDPAAMTETIRRAVTDVDPDQPIYDVKTMDQRVSDASASRRFSMSLLAIFAALALLIAAMGLYAVIGYMVSQRTREIGIRIALGAQPTEVRRMVVMQGTRLAGIGLAIGLVGSLALSGVMKRFLFSVEATDPVTFLAVAFALTLVAVVASWVPARRASRVNPMVALRQD
jgi:putative ABC transport system permease protein